jgi:hypothetical protein
VLSCQLCCAELLLLLLLPLLLQVLTKPGYYEVKLLTTSTDLNIQVRQLPQLQAYERGSQPALLLKEAGCLAQAMHWLPQVATPVACLSLRAGPGGDLAVQGAAALHRRRLPAGHLLSYLQG